MNKFLSRPLIVIFVISQLCVTSSFAQSNDSLEGIVDDTKQDILLVLGGGLAGAVLGLSTLSFVEEPKDHTRNILVGASIGIIAGVALVAFKQANKSRDLIYSSDPGYDQGASIDFKTFERGYWHGNKHAELNSSLSSLNTLAVSFTY